MSSHYQLGSGDGRGTSERQRDESEDLTRDWVELELGTGIVSLTEIGVGIGPELSDQTALA